ncbi:phosphoribosylaminoimidazolesuccinocarboxamide synthase [Frigoribacterium sp. CFBP 13729]|uniref:phosphoribosylaminoimidazolesuccinocarboxamide synthase n=1 Tax=Frigoribacterium sp. CFBP 13729 TaxID=2775293 RepID=UPI0017856D63|nr:phosphoribosylaminoimidazolesuccinocarboxamide synthase [Frigoribacterium sp. CFBP 13729]MBD8611800.1 phosphoribosylaminoimidazolesuccinocarboxamide synthase [Frigoribacterium sp. CFBP 13729]
MTAEAPELAGWVHAYSGKVRDLYVPAPAAGSGDDAATLDAAGDAAALDAAPALDAAEHLLVVASDRVSAYDVVLEPGIPGKGALLTQLSTWWFDQLEGVPNHLVDPTTASVSVPAAVRDRAMLVKPLDMYPVECVVRGYLVGSGWAEYRETGRVCGIELPAGLHDGDRLPEPIYTPAYKAPLGEHDENISFERTVELVGADVAAALRDTSLEIYRRASMVAEAQGVVLADTKFEFGADRSTGELTLGDEVLTSDSSRFWDAGGAGAAGASSGTGSRTDSFDKQIVRNWLSDNWDKTGTPPALPPEIVERTAARYRELIERLTAH